MAIATPFYEKTDEQKAIVEMVRQFVDEQIIPQAEHYDHEDEFPEPIVEQMKELGLFGTTIPEEYGGMGLDLTTYAMIVEELSRGWISISGVVNTHFIGSYLLMKFGTDEQKQRLLPKMATGEIRAAFSLSEPELGSDVAAIKTTGVKTDDGDWEINGQKMWVTNGLRSGVVFVLVRTDKDAETPQQGMTCFVCEKEPGARENPGLTVPPQIKKLGYKGVESTELVFDGYRCPADMILGGEEAGLNKGFPQMMDALEVGRVNVAARGVGIAQRALELALRYSQERKAFGKPIAQHQAIQFKLADMATKVEAARLLTLKAARMKDAGERSDLEAGMAKLFASEAGKEVVEDSFRIHGGYGYCKEYEIERLYRDAPLLLIGEGTSRDPAHGDRPHAAAAPQDLDSGPQIEDYALIGDTQTAALVGRDGSIDWLCLPRFDSAACFAALLGDARQRPLAARARRRACSATERRYRDDTLVLETEFDTADGRGPRHRLHAAARRARPTSCGSSRASSGRVDDADGARSCASTTAASCRGCAARRRLHARGRRPRRAAAATRRSRRTARTTTTRATFAVARGRRACRSCSPGTRRTSPRRRPSTPRRRVDDTERVVARLDRRLHLRRRVPRRGASAR